MRVDGKQSAYDAFYDAHIRWKMIINRIQYSGGFIDSRQVLNALNITRTCKQPSWFSQSLAERIISEYCTSNTIYDLAAGWGARYDAAKKLGKKYVGCDYNKALVDWHHELGRNTPMAEILNMMMIVLYLYVHLIAIQKLVDVLKIIILKVLMILQRG